MSTSRLSQTAEIDAYKTRLSCAFKKPIPYTEIEQILIEHEAFCRASKINRDLISLGKGIWDFYYDEFYPSLTLIDKIYRTAECLYFYPRNNGPHDLIITGSSFADHIEITMAKDGQRSRLQNELLAKQGRATASGPIYRDRKTKQIVEISSAILHDDSVALAIKLIKTALICKATKRYETKTALICGFSECDYFIEDNDDYAALVDAAYEIVPEMHGFERIYLTGTKKLGFVCQVK